MITYKIIKKDDVQEFTFEDVPCIPECWDIEYIECFDESHYSSYPHKVTEQPFLNKEIIIRHKEGGGLVLDLRSRDFTVAHEFLFEWLESIIKKEIKKHEE